MNSIAVILPAFNEELTIVETIEAFHRHLPMAEIVVVNNNSTDATGTHANQVFSDHGIRGRVIDEPRQGKGNAVRRAFSEVDADIYVLADADLTYPAEQVAQLIGPVLKNEADMVVGDRHANDRYRRENKRLLHNFGNKLVRKLVNSLFRADLRDIMSGYRAFSRRFVKNYPILVEGFEIETDMTLHALDKRFRILEVPVDYRDRPEGSDSKLNTFSDGARVLFTIAQILRYYRPMLFFGVLGVVFVLLGLVAAIPVFSDWINYRYIYHVPLAVLAASVELVAVMAFTIGLILDSNVQQHKRGFEAGLLRYDQES
ncbi:MAG TPA: glycosyltransferase, partial [Chromatiales bacterium]|nr:glycosyltransferase [Chromatiales bacterium]